MKKILTLALLVSSFGFAVLQAQTVTIAPATEFIQTGDFKGIKTLLYLDEKMVAKEWKEFLKKYGKVESPKGGKDTYTVAIARMPNVSFMPVVATSKIASSDGATTIFYAIKLDTAFITDPKHPKYPIPRDLLHDFGMRMYRQQVDREIAGAEKELDSRTKKHAQLVRKGESLRRDVEQNKKNKIDYGNQLVKNHNDSIQLVRNTETNQAAQSQAQTALDAQRQTTAGVSASLMPDSASTGKKKRKSDVPPELRAANEELNKSQKIYEKNVQEGKTLVKNTERNQKQKTDLQEKIVKNARDLERLLQDTETNKKDVAEAQTQVEKQKTVAGQVRSKMNDIK